MTHEAQARLELPLSQAVNAFEQVAGTFGLSTERCGGALRILAKFGAIELAECDGATLLRISSDAAHKLQQLRDFISEKIAAAGQTIAWQGARAAARPANLSLATIERIERISPSYTRVVMAGPDLARFAEGNFHFRLLLGPEGADWPTTDEHGVTNWPGGSQAWHRPVYTTREIERLGGEAARIVFDVFLHDGGRVTEWTRRARAGEEIAVTGPNGSGMPRKAGWTGIVADETAVPVAARIMAALDPATTGEAVLFVPDAADIQEIAHPPGLALRWVLRSGAETPVEALRSLHIPDDDRFVFFASERGETAEARRWLPEQGLAKTEFFAAAYWTDPATQAR